METYQNILVVIDPTTNEHKALKRAIDLASKINHNNASPTKVSAFLSIFDFSYEMTTILSSEERDVMRQSMVKDKKLWLENLINELNTDIEINCQVVWHNRPFEAIIELVIKQKVLINMTNSNQSFSHLLIGIFYVNAPALSYW